MIRYVFAVLAGVGLVTAGRAEDPLLTAARRRQEAAKAVRIEFHTKEFIAKGGVSADKPRLPGTVAGPLPTADTELESDNAITLIGQKVRVENNHPRWSISTGKANREAIVSVSNGKVSGATHDNKDGRNPWPTGNINKRTYMEQMTLPTFVSIFIHFRGLLPGLSPVVLKDVKADDASVVIEGRRCLGYKHILSTSYYVEIWVDPQADYITRRYKHVRSGHVVRQSDMRYRADSTIGWVPTEWTLTEFTQDGRVASTATNTVTALAFDPPAADEQFELQFSPGMHVHDQRNTQDYRVRDDGYLQPITPFGKDVSGSIPPPGAGWVVRNRWLFPISGAAVAAGLMAYWWYRRRCWSA